MNEKQEVNGKQGETLTENSVRTESENTNNRRFSVKPSTLPFQGAGQGLFTEVTLEKGDRVLDYITMTGQDRSTSDEQVCLLTQEEYERKYPDNDATHVLDNKNKTSEHTEYNLTARQKTLESSTYCEQMQENDRKNEE